MIGGTVMFTRKFLVKPGKNAKLKFKLSRYDAGDTAVFKSKEHAGEILEKNLKRLDDLQYLLYADGGQALLLVFQAMDAGGKDGTIRHVMSGVNPQGCQVTSFKQPSALELSHDFLWRIHRAVPAKGMIGIFNRSHYEDVLVVRVHDLVSRSVWSERYDQINAFEKNLSENNVRIVKFFLHISKEEQKKRFQDRLGDKTKNWKLSPADTAEREYWNDYMRAYEDVLTRCSTPWAPWYVIPADHKWFRNLVVSQVIVDTLEEMKLKIPAPKFDLSKIKIK
jgi:PPK2 family polyphosphate:nucleotide phosphotransferase